MIPPIKSKRRFRAERIEIRSIHSRRGRILTRIAPMSLLLLLFINNGLPEDDKNALSWFRCTF
jgi:hypothetical protein